MTEERKLIVPEPPPHRIAPDPGAPKDETPPGVKFETIVGRVKFKSSGK